MKPDKISVAFCCFLIAAILIIAGIALSSPLVVSDPVRLAVPPLSNLAVSMYFPGSVSATTEHSLAVQTTYVSMPGNFASATSMPAGGTTTTSWYFVNGVEVTAEGRPAAAIVALGDSITDGYASTVDANRRWPNSLAARLQARPFHTHFRPNFRRLPVAGFQHHPARLQLKRAGKADGCNERTFDRFWLSP